MKRLIAPSTQRHLDIFDSDWAYISARWGKAGGGRPSGITPIGTANIIRSIVHKWVLAHQEYMNQASTELPQSPELTEQELSDETAP